MKSLPLVFLFFIVAELAYAVDVPKPFSATYAGRKYLVYTAQAVITLNRHGDSLKYTMSSDVNGPFYHNEYYDCSVMLVQKDNIYPLEHLHTDKKEKNTITIHCLTGICVLQQLNLVMEQKGRPKIYLSRCGMRYHLM